MLQPEFSGFRSFLPITDDTFLRNGDADIRIGVSSCCCSSTRHNWHTPATGLNTSTIPIMDMNGTGFVFGASVQLTPVSVLPVHKGSIQSGSGGALLNNPYGVFVSGHYAYVTSSGSSALEIVNISNPASPTHAGSIVDGSGGALLNSPYGVFVSGNYAYVTNYDSSALEIVDVTDPLIPVHSGNLTDGGGSIPCLSLPTGLYVAGNYAYVASHGSDALEIVNVTNPANPVHAARLDDGSGVAPFLDNPLSLFISGNYAYVASSHLSIRAAYKTAITERFLIIRFASSCQKNTRI